MTPFLTAFAVQSNVVIHFWIISVIKGWSIDTMSSVFLLLFVIVMVIDMLKRKQLVAQVRNTSGLMENINTLLCWRSANQHTMCALTSSQGKSHTSRVKTTSISIALIFDDHIQLSHSGVFPSFLCLHCVQVEGVH